MHGILVEMWHDPLNTKSKDANTDQNHSQSAIFNPFCKNSSRFFIESLRPDVNLNSRDRKK